MIDTGIRQTHVEFAGRALSGFDAIGDGNGTDDGHEDRDDDTVSDGQEVAHGTDPFAPDSDGDGWPDEAELLSTETDEALFVMIGIQARNVRTLAQREVQLGCRTARAKAMCTHLPTTGRPQHVGHCQPEHRQATRTVVS